MKINVDLILEITILFANLGIITHCLCSFINQSNLSGIDGRWKILQVLGKHDWLFAQSLDLISDKM